MYTSFSIAGPISPASSFCAGEAEYEPMPIWRVNILFWYDDSTYDARCSVSIRHPDNAVTDNIVSVCSGVDGWKDRLLDETVHFIYKHTGCGNDVLIHVCDILRSQGLDLPADPPKYDYLQTYEYLDQDIQNFERTVLDTLKDVVDLDQKVGVTCCASAAIKLSLRALVIHWNDNHKYSLLEIADRLEALDADIELKPKELT